MAGISVRRANSGDCAALTALMLRSSAYQGRYRKMIENYPVTPAMVAAGEVWVAQVGDELAGFYRLDLDRADLDLMFVDDKVRGTGIGRAIFDHMKSFAAASGLREVQIVAHPPSVEFYRRMGAVDVGVIRAKRSDRWDRPVLRLTISA
jgi:GNAT superfamily N-acetyltransferase